MSRTGKIATTIQTNVVDGAENNPPTVIHQKHYEVAKYYTLTEHLMVPEIFVFSKKVWDTLSPTDQILIRKAAALTVPKERELWTAMVDEALKELDDMGYNVIKEVDKEPFIAATEPVRAKFGDKYAELIKKIQAVK